MAHKGHEAIGKEIDDAKKRVKIGGIYSHYKNPDMLYEVIGFAVQESTDKLCVIYQAKYGKKLTFVRDLDSWLEEPLKGTPRFRPVR